MKGDASADVSPFVVFCGEEMDVKFDLRGNKNNLSYLRKMYHQTIFRKTLIKFILLSGGRTSRASLRFRLNARAVRPCVLDSMHEPCVTAFWPGVSPADAGSISCGLLRCLRWSDRRGCSRRGIQTPGSRQWCRRCRRRGPG